MICEIIKKGEGFKERISIDFVSVVKRTGQDYICSFCDGTGGKDALCYEFKIKDYYDNPLICCNGCYNQIRVRGFLHKRNRTR